MLDRGALEAVVGAEVGGEGAENSGALPRFLFLVAKTLKMSWEKS